MAKRTSRWHFIAGLISILLITTACFQQVGDVSDTTVVSQLRPSDTPTATRTPQPTNTPSVTETPTSARDLPIGERVTATPFGGTIVAQAGDEQPTEDRFVLTADAYIRDATATASFPLTLTAQAQGIGFPTSTPTATATDILLISPTPTQFTGGGGAACIHQVRAGDNMFRLSQYYGVPINQIATANGIINPSLIIVGQQLTIPGCGTTGNPPPPTFTPTSSPFGTGGPTQPGTPFPTGNFIQHTVQQYETLFEISLRYNVPIDSIVAANGIQNPNRIEYGQVLQIPSQ